MTRKVDINVHHVTRVEGHGNIRVRATDGVVEQCEWQVPEAPRFFEAMVCGRPWEDLQTIVSRICGICSVTHSLAAIKAIEDAMKVEVSEQTHKLRLLTHYGEQLESHVLHIGYLVAPDLLGQKSVLPLVRSDSEIVKKVIACHRVGNLVMETLAGRKTHPVRLVPGGFTMLPTMAELQDLRQQLEACLSSLDDIAAVVFSLLDKLPDFQRETEYIALVSPSRYPFYDGDIGSTDTEEVVPTQEFERVVHEYMVPQSTAKWCRWHRDAYAVGALARFTLNADFLLPRAARTGEMLGLKKGLSNPYWNTVAQMVECVHVVERSVQLLDELLVSGIQEDRVDVKPQAGVGVGCLEAPRGILFHKYEFDDAGVCVAANLTIPTNQNHGNIQRDLEILTPTLLDREQDEIRLLLEMLVRAYDPCISCSTHYLNVEFV